LLIGIDPSCIMHFLSFNGAFSSRPLRESGTRFVKNSYADRGVHIAIPFCLCRI
jgi:hypothetical protein